MSTFSNKQELQVIIERFIASTVSDAAVADLCKDINATLSFMITDFDFNFYLNFEEGNIGGGIGDANPPSMVVLEMDGEILDGILSGEIDPTGAAMSGQMTFSGDMGAAMSLLTMNQELNRIFLESKG